jgi:hypothetical protein
LIGNKISGVLPEVMSFFLNFTVERRKPCHEEMVTRGEFDEPGDEVAPRSWTLVLD